MKKEGKKRKSSHVWYLHAYKNKQNKQTNKMYYQCVCITSVLILAYVQPS